MNVYLWTAGTSAGVTDDHGRARIRAADAMLAIGATSALVETVHYDDDMKSLEAGYVRAGGMQWTATRHGETVTWTSCWADPPAAPAPVTAP